MLIASLQVPMSKQYGYYESPDYDENIPPPGNRSLFTVAKIAKTHHVKVILPTSIIMGMEGIV